MANRKSKTRHVAYLGSYAVGSAGPPEEQGSFVVVPRDSPLFHLGWLFPVFRLFVSFVLLGVEHRTSCMIERMLPPSLSHSKHILKCFSGSSVQLLKLSALPVICPERKMKASHQRAPNLTNLSIFFFLNFWQSLKVSRIEIVLRDDSF